jgi:hypothetical protein
MTIEDTDTLLRKLALKNYLLAFEPVVYNERNEYMIRAKKAEKALDLKDEQLESKDRALASYVAVMASIKEAHKKEIRKIRWNAWRDRVILGTIAAIQFIYILKN